MSDRNQVDINGATSSVPSGGSTGVWLRRFLEAGGGQRATTVFSELPQLSREQVWDIFWHSPTTVSDVLLPGVIKTSPIKKGPWGELLTSVCPACKLFPCPGIPETIGKNPPPSLCPPCEKKKKKKIVGEGKSPGTGMVFHQSGKLRWCLMMAEVDIPSAWRRTLVQQGTSTTSTTSTTSPAACPCAIPRAGNEGQTPNAHCTEPTQANNSINYTTRPLLPTVNLY